MVFFLIPLTMSTIVAIFTFLISIPFLTWISKRIQGKRGSKYKTQPPKAYGAWPIIGHLHLLGELPHVTLGSMADKNGPIFMIKLGVDHVVVVSDSKLAKECLTTNDKVFANRPKFTAAKVMGYNYANFGLASYGDYWRGIRKISITELLSSTRLDMLREIRVYEVNASFKEMYEFWLSQKETSSSNMVKIEMKQWFSRLIQNYVVKLIAGKRYAPGEEEGVRFQKTTRRFFELIGAFNVSDAFPYLRWFDFGGQEKEMKVIAKDMDSILEIWLDEHKRKRVSSDFNGQKHDFMDAIISIVEDDSVKDRMEFDPNTIIKATTLALLVAATDTTTTTLIWALALLLNNPTVIRKVREELDIHVGKDRQVEESDLKNLVYLQAIIKETLRLYPAGPLSMPHESMEDCTVDGYYIPKGTRLLVNLWKIHRDKQVWSDDSFEFKPDRFLNSPYKDMDVRGQDFELIPFGSGRRMCPGISFALQIMGLTLGRLVHGFEFEKISDEAIDMKESFGLTIMKATPLELNFRPRLSPNLY